MDIIAVENQHASGLYARRKRIIVRGQGASLWDEAGREYIDCTAGHGVANLGHAHPAVARAVAAQAARLITLPETFYNDRRAALMQRMATLAPGMERVFFCNSGTEAIEAAIKFSRLSTGRTQIIAAMRGFHGRTLGALSATWNKAYRQPFEPLTPGFSHVAYNNVAALEQAVTGETAAVLLEVVQGEGGVHLATREYLQAARRITQERGALLVIDEVQTGFGRTGQMFAIQHYGVTPDLLCMAKSLAGGLPMGAVLIGEAVKNLAPGHHASTFGGNPLACAAALAVLDVMEQEQLPRQAAEKGAYLIERLRQLPSPLVREVRGLGLMIGVELKQKVSPYLQALEERGLLCLPAG
ncbi:MAG: aspartate aminotransferase family protein, partial [Chloroflexi bacterium]|nr:aspartate aminotransferase family protein [Chloroflexota bacterium]